LNLLGNLSRYRLTCAKGREHRIFNPKRDITLSSLQRAALVGRRVAIELVSECYALRGWYG
jgi:hypothetical protein